MRPSMLVLSFVAATAGPLFAADRTLPPKRLGPLLRWLRAGTYSIAYTPEPQIRISATAHGMHVRTWYNPVLADDLRAGTLPFRSGATMVKELFFEGTETVVGWSVMRKVRRRSAGGRGWFFFETLDGKRAIARGRRVGLCVGCHEEGTDFLLTEFRPAP